MLTDREIAHKYTFYKFRIGSEILGTNLPGSEDHDEMGLVIEPPTVIFGCRRTKTLFHGYRYKIRDGVLMDGRNEANNTLTKPGDIDGRAYSLNKWVGMLTQGHSNQIQVLYLPETDILQGVQYYDAFVYLRALVRSITVLDAFIEYGKSQYHKLVKHGFDKARRQDLIDRFGFDTKFAYHAYRIVQQGIEYAETGSLTIPLPPHIRHTCLDIRNGVFSREKVAEIIESRVFALERLRAISTFPSEPQFERIDAWTARMYRTMWEGWETSRFATANTPSVEFA